MKTKKKILSMLISMGVVLSLTACGDGEKSKETTEAKDSISIESTSDVEKETDSSSLETTTTEQPTTTQKPTTQESTTKQEPTTSEVVVDENRDKYIAAAKKATEQYSGQATAFDDVDGDGIPELIYAQSMAGRSYEAYFFVYENGEYKNSNMYISMYEGMRLYKNNASGKYFGLEISEHRGCVVFYLHDFDNLKSQELAYIEEIDGTYVYKNESLSSVEQVKEKMFAEMEKEYTYIRDMSDVVIWENNDTSTMLEKAYDNYMK